MEGYDDDTGGGGETGGEGGLPTAGVRALGPGEPGLRRCDSVWGPPQVSELSVEALLSRHAGRMRSDALIAHFEPLSSLDRRKLSETVKSVARVLLPAHAGAPGIVVLRSTLAREAAEARAAGVIQAQCRARQLRSRLLYAAERVQAAARGRQARERRAAVVRAAGRARARAVASAAVTVQRWARGEAARAAAAALRRKLIIAGETEEERAGREAREREERLRAKLRQRRQEQQEGGGGGGGGVAPAGGDAVPGVQSRQQGGGAKEVAAAREAEGAEGGRPAQTRPAGPSHAQPSRGVRLEAEAARQELRRLVSSGGARVE